MKKHLFLYFLLISFTLFSQKKYSKQLSFVTDNDLYVSLVKDRYYTSGIFFNFQQISKNKSENLAKKIFEYQIGHEMFSPNSAIVKTISEHDRPFAAHLYASFGIKRVYKSKKIFTTSFQLGTIGPNALGKNLQDFVHNIYGYKKATGWKHQISKAISVNVNAAYSSFLIKNDKNTFDISWVNAARLGTVYTNVSSGLFMRYSFTPLQEMMNSLAFNTNLNNENTDYFRAVESFFYAKPSVRYAIYDATLQGSFLNNASDVTTTLVPLVFTLEVGFKFTANRFNFGYTFNYNTNKAENLRYNNGQNYGRIVVAYLFH